MYNFDRPFWIVRTVRQRNSLVLPRIIMSLASGFVLAGLGLIAARVIFGGGLFFVPRSRAWASRRLQEDDVAVAMAVAAIVWTFLQYFIWSRLERAGWLVRALLHTLGIGISTIFLCILVAASVRPDEAVIILGIVMITCAAILLVWTSAVLGRVRFRAVLMADNVVDVRCPQCQYSLVGLQELRCPECGTAFTIDELIRAQNYGARLPETGMPPTDAACAVLHHADRAAPVANALQGA